MSAASTWNAFVWTYFAKPKCDRALFRRIKQRKPQRIVEIGVNLTRATRMISLAQKYREDTIHYCGIDLFEARVDGDPLKLKHTHHQLAQTGAKIRLVPGEMVSAIARSANNLTKTDLLIVSAEHSREELQAIFPFLPRMLHAETSIARYTDADGGIRLRWMKPDSFVTPKRRAA